MSATWIVAILVLAIVAVMFAGPLVVGGWLYWRDRAQRQHAVLRNFPLLGRLRYVFEHVGPELRQYLFNSDRGGEPFSRDEYQAIVFGGKYLNALISFGSHRDFDQPGWYLRNAIFPAQYEELRVDREPSIATWRYRVDDEGLFARKEHMEPRKVAPWTFTDDAVVVLGADLRHPWPLRGLVGMSGMSYGALGRHAIRAMSEGVALATGSWMNTGEGGLSEHHLVGGADVVFQIGPGLFGVRTEAGAWDWPLFREQAAIPRVRGFELKLHQGAKIRGGHVEGAKVTPEIARIRRVTPWKTIDSPNRFRLFHTVDELLDHVARMREEGGRPVGVKVVVGGPGSVDELAAAMASRGDGPDWITVDGGEGGSGATFLEMADSMGLPVQSAIVEMDDALRRHGVRERVRIFASGKLVTPDRVALALCLGADAVNIGRGLMISVGCIQAQKCHTNRCPVGVATTDEQLMKALVIDEKKWRVANYLITLRAGLATLAAAAGLASPSAFRREHAVFRDALGRAWTAEELFPTARSGDAPRPAPAAVPALPGRSASA
ncbi:MAG: FMN-binding glutamate synthase family protein [Myxococcota bacterium]|nr:FMN-binding glutamate synthase family protein [Myxococcota bacterium]